MKNLIILIIIIFPNLLHSQLVNDLKVNLDTNLSYPKYYSSVSSNIKGNTVVSWEARGNSLIRIYSQIFDSSFNRVGGNFSLNSISGYESNPFVSVRKDGSFGIIWTGLSTNPYGAKILLKIYNKNGIPISTEIQINDTIIPYNGNYSIGTDTSGRFIVAFDYPIPNSALPNVYFQIVDSNGIKIGNNVKVNQFTSYGKPSIAVNKNGSFAIAWRGSQNLFPRNIYCQLFSSNGSPVGNNVQVNENSIDTIDTRDLPDIAADSSGKFVVAFHEIPYSTGVDVIKYQRFDANGNKIGYNKTINNAFFHFRFSSDEVGNLIFLFSFISSGNSMVNLRIDKNDNYIGTFYYASNYPVSKTGNDIVFVNKNYINLWRDNRLGGTNPQVFMNVRSYSNPDSVVSVNINNTEIPASYSLSQNYPNPFNPSTTIKFDVPPLSSPNVSGGDLVQLKIYDITGREIAVLVNQKLIPGSYSAVWNASDFPSGIYFYRIQAGTFIQSKIMAFIK